MRSYNKSVPKIDTTYLSNTRNSMVFNLKLDNIAIC